MLIHRGTLKVGDAIVAGDAWGRVRALYDYRGERIQEARPGEPVEILGFDKPPPAGELGRVVESERRARELAHQRGERLRRESLARQSSRGVSLETLFSQMQSGAVQDLNIVIKGDVQGSVEAVADTLAKLSTEKVKLSIVHAGVGAITEGDVNLAIASKALIIGFNVRPAGKANALAEENKIEIRLYSIIYQAIDDVRGAMEGLLPATLVEKTNGKAEARQIFKIKGQVVAGSYIIEGDFKRAGMARLIRGGAVLWTGKVSALKRFKDDVKDVAEGFECGISLEGYSDIKELDIIESYDVEEVKQKL